VRPYRSAHPLPLLDDVRLCFLDELAHSAEVSPRQSPSSAILFEMSSDADSPWLTPDFFMFSS
jgi:hypothetical protein